MKWSANRPAVDLSVQCIIKRPMYTDIYLNREMRAPARACAYASAHARVCVHLGIVSASAITPVKFFLCMLACFEDCPLLLSHSLFVYCLVKCRCILI